MAAAPQRGAAGPSGRGKRGRAQASQNHDTVCLMRIDDLPHARDGGVMQVAPSTDYYSHGFYKNPVTGSGELDRTK